LWLAALNPRALDMIKHCGIFDKLGRERTFFNLEQAIEAYTAGRSK